MPLNIKDPRTEQLANEVAAMTGESKTGAIRTALQERKARLEITRGSGDREHVLRVWLSDTVWSKLPEGVRGHAPTQAEQDVLLGYVDHQQ
jgi:antitoxin VapB